MPSNPITMRPRPETKTGRVWELADSISRQKGRRASRSEVMEAFQIEGGNPNTASTQYSYWRADFDRRAEESETPAGDQASLKQVLTVGPEGRLLIPFEFRKKMGIETGGRVSVSLENGEMRVVPPGAALKRLKQLVREMDKGSGSVVEELIRDRRAEEP